MIPRTLSASSLQVARLCMDRWNAEYMNRAPSFSNSAADVGTAFHGGAEAFVKALFVDKTHDVTTMTRPQQKQLLITFYQMSYVQTFGTADMETEEYKDGFQLTMRWFERTDLTTKPMLKVESAELKETIKVPYNHPDGQAHRCEKCASTADEQPGVCYVDFNYIMDRVDQIGETEWEVVDYKTVRAPIQPEDLENKLQARAYALAIQIKHPGATRITVTFDLIRHNPVGLVFTREDNISFWRSLCAETQRIVDTMESDIRPTLNPECGYCVKKFTCKLLQKNITAGGIHSLSPEDASDLLEQVRNQVKGLKNVQEGLEEKLLRYAAQSDQLDWTTTNGVVVDIGVPNKRSFDASRAAQIMGPELFAQMGNMTLGNLEKIIKDESLPKDMRDQLNALITKTNGNLQLKVSRKATL